ncbi:hypothetical protein SLS61_002694 [Didymella pomorum]
MGVRQLLGKVGFGWTVRVLGLLNVVSLTFCIAFMHPRLPPRKTGPLVDWAAFRDAPYCLQVLGTCCMMPPVYCVFYYVASYARDELGMPYTESLNLVIILNGVGLPARVLPGFIADRFIGVLNVQAIALVFNVIMLWTWLSVNSIAGYYVWVVFYGLGAGAFQSLFPSVIGRGRKLYGANLLGGIKHDGWHRVVRKRKVHQAWLEAVDKMLSTEWRRQSTCSVGYGTPLPSMPA